MDLVSFYLGKAPDLRGRMLEELLRWSDARIEAGHDFIQTLFPLREPSQHVPNTPVLDDASLAEFRQNPAIQKNLLRSFQMMLGFYGFRIEPDSGKVVPAEEFSRKAAGWLFIGDHNHLRITRILKCLTACGMGVQANAFLTALLAIAEPGKVSKETVNYWKRAVESPV